MTLQVNMFNSVRKIQVRLAHKAVQWQAIRATWKHSVLPGSNVLPGSTGLRHMNTTTGFYFRRIFLMERILVFHIGQKPVIEKCNHGNVQYTVLRWQEQKVDGLGCRPYQPVGLVDSDKFVADFLPALAESLFLHQTTTSKEKDNQQWRGYDLVQQYLLADGCCLDGGIGPVQKPIPAMIQRAQAEANQS